MHRQRKPKISGILAYFSSPLLCCCLAAHSLPALAQSPLWPSPRNEIEDQSNTPEAETRFQVAAPKGSVGQVFVPSMRSLHRLELLLSNLYDPDPVRVRIWRWNGTPKATVAQDPLFEDRLPMTGNVRWQHKSVFPRIEVEPGRPYYFEITGPERTTFATRGSRDGQDHYPAGRIWISEVKPELRANDDIWFRTFAPAAGELAEPQARPSGPTSSWEVPAHTHQAVDRSDYLRRVEDYTRHLQRRSADGCGKHSHNHAFFPAFRYKISCELGACDEDSARAALAMLERAVDWWSCRFSASQALTCASSCRHEVANFNWLWHPVTAVSWLDGSPSMSAPLRAKIQDMFMARARTIWAERWRGSFNRSLVVAASLLQLSRLYPGETDSAAWREFAQSIWQNFWRFKDTEEDSASYVADVSWPAILQLADLLGYTSEIWRDDDFISLVDRYHEQVLPLGVIPGYGDGSGWAYDSTGLIWLLEAAATHRREGRYKWTAHRIFSYNETKSRHKPPKWDSWDQSLPFLAHAYLSSDEAIRPTPPSRAQSVLLTRNQVIRRRTQDQGYPPQFGDISGRKVPSKLIFRSGPSEDDMTLFVNLLAGYRHGHTNLGAIVSLTDRGSVLLSETAFPYWNFSRAPEAESIAFLRRYWGGIPREQDQSVQITRFEEHSNLTTAWFQWNGLEGWDVQQERRIYFVKNRFVWIRDRFTFSSPMSASMGPIIHFADLHSTSGPNWFNAYYQTPTRNVWRYKNPENYCLIYFIPKSDGRTEGALIDTGFLPHSNCRVTRQGPIPPECRAPPPYLAYQRWTGEAKSRTVKWFDTLLVPTPKPIDPSGADSRAKIRVLQHPEHAVSIEVKLDGERWLLLENPEKSSLENSFIRSDATVAIVGLREGEASYLNAHEATFVEVDGVRRSWPVPTSEESGSFPVARTNIRPK